jgi:hypothetical protein
LSRSEPIGLPISAARTSRRIQTADERPLAADAIGQKRLSVVVRFVVKDPDIGSNPLRREF